MDSLTNEILDFELWIVANLDFEIWILKSGFLDFDTLCVIVLGDAVWS